MTTPKRLTPEQLAAARQQLETQAAQDNAALTDQIVFEAKRDELAYELIRQAAAEIPKRRLAFGDAQKLAAEQLKAAESAAPAVTVAPEAPAPEAPAVAEVPAEAAPAASPEPVFDDTEHAAPEAKKRRR